MGWRDRDYNRGGEAAREFFNNPASMLAFALPIGRWFGSRVTLHFWMLLTFLFLLVDSIRDLHNFLPGVIAAAALFITAMLHEFGHRFTARRAGGHHEEFVLWPFGGLQLPQSPPHPGPLFLANIGGILVNVILCVAFGTTFYLLTERTPLYFVWSLSPLYWIRLAFGFPDAFTAAFGFYSIGPAIVQTFFIYNLGMMVVNLLPYYWFDGGNLWQSILWPQAGLHRAISWTCIAGMVIAVPLICLAVFATDLLSIVFFVLLFSSAYVRRQSLKNHELGEFDGGLDYGFANPPAPRRLRSRKRAWFRSAARKAAEERAEQIKIDAILAKVHDKGLHSLTWWEKRTLRKATERQRQRDQELAKIEP